MYRVLMQEADVADQVIGEGFTKRAAWERAWQEIRTAAGPLAVQPTTWNQFADAVANAFGGDAAVVIEEQ